jgi:hypothetical protein
MSANFPNEVYVPTGTAEGKDFIQISGYCYKKVAEDVTVVDKPVRSDIFGDFDNCTDCNTCECNKTIDFFIGGIQYSNGAQSFIEKQISIKTSSKGWQEIAIESGYLNSNDPSKTFKPLQVRCYDRKIDMRSGIYVSFNDRNAEIARFDYITEGDLYERQDLYNESLIGEQGALPPDWTYKNQYDRVGLANKINTIKFKSLCEYDCPTQDITFRIRGQINEPGAYLNIGSQYDIDTTSWVYATCTGVPTTPGQIIDCMPSGSGINFTDYFAQGYNGPVGAHHDDRPGGYYVTFAPTSMDVVNMPLLLGETGSDEAKKFSVTGGRHHLDYMFDNYSFYTNFSARSTTSAALNSGIFYYASDGNEVDFDYAEDIGKPFGIYYNRPEGCLSNAVTGTDFNTYYRHLGGNTLASAASDGDSRGDKYDGCYQTSEFADGIFKNGTYVPMYFTGTIELNAEEYFSFIDSNFAQPADVENWRWQTGIYVYQWYKDADMSDPNSVTGFFGYLSDGTTQEQHNHYKSLLLNSSPVNLDNPLNQWTIKSGNYAAADSQKQGFCFLLNFNSNLAYEYGFVRADNGLRHSGDDTTSASYQFTYGSSSYLKNAYDNYAFAANGSDGAINRLDEPEIATNTFVRPSTIDEKYPLTDSGNALHSDISSPIEYTNEIQEDFIEMEELKNIKFQLSWKKE